MIYATITVVAPGRQVCGIGGSCDSGAYDLSAFPELVEMCRKWTYTLEELKAMGLLEKEDK